MSVFDKPPVEPPEYWYRFDSYSEQEFTFDVDGDLEQVHPRRYKASHRKIRVHHHTPKGVQLILIRGALYRFVDKNARKRWACPTVKEALISFIERKKKHIQHVRATLDRITDELQWAQEDLDEMKRTNQ